MVDTFENIQPIHNKSLVLLVCIISCHKKLFGNCLVNEVGTDNILKSSLTRIRTELHSLLVVESSFKCWGIFCSISVHSRFLLFLYNVYILRQIDNFSDCSLFFAESTKSRKWYFQDINFSAIMTHHSGVICQNR